MSVGFHRAEMGLARMTHFKAFYDSIKQDWEELLSGF